MRIIAISRREVSSQVVVVLCAVAGNIPLGALVWFFYLRGLSSTVSIITGIIYFLLTYNALAYSTFHIFNMSDTARRIKILGVIKTSGKVKVSGLRLSYDAGEMLANRIDRLIGLGQIRKSGDRYILNSHLLYYAAKSINFWGSVLGLASMKSLYMKKK